MDVNDRRLDLHWVLDRNVDEKRKLKSCRAWFRQFASFNLEKVRQFPFAVSRERLQVTLIAYVFFDREKDFSEVEFAILHTWRVLGKLSLVLVVDRMTDVLREFQARHPDVVRICVSSVLRPGSVDSMGADCVINLHRYFDTPYCLVIQNDGFPLRPGLDEFVGRYDYLGAPAVINSWRQGLADILLLDCLNGGFSLRSHHCCRMAAQTQSEMADVYGLDHLRLEDWFYCKVVRRNLRRRMQLRFPWAWEARRFSVIDFYGKLDVRSLGYVPFGVHGPTTVFQFKDYLCDTYEYRDVSAERTSSL